MKWRNYTYKEKLEIYKKKYGFWHKWFAWYPVIIGSHKYWLEVVYRKGSFDSYKGHSSDSPRVEWEYAENLFQIIQIEEKRKEEQEHTHHINLILPKSIPYTSFVDDDH